MLKNWFGLPNSLGPVMALMACCAVGSAQAAVVERWAYDLQVQRKEVLETLSWKVLIEDLDDIEEWSELPVYLDEHRELVSAEGWVVSPDGERRRLKRKEKDLRQATSSWELSSSRQLLVFEPEQLLPGGRLEVQAQIRETPYYPGTVIRLRPRSEIFEAFEVSVRVAPDVEGFRYLFHGPLEDPEKPNRVGPSAAVHEVTENGLRVTGNWARRPLIPELAADTEIDPILVMAWDSAATWDGVGRWYRGILEGLPTPGAEIQRQAQELMASFQGQSPNVQRRRLEALVAFVRAKVRYVAVEVGIGGYRPSPSKETLDRRWGDCKDKSFLLIDLLRNAGVEAYPALVRLGEDGRILEQFPSPFGFNHLIVAVATGGLETRDGDPISDGFLFIDPTQTTGSAGYLHTEVQDQAALVVLPTEGRLVRTPILPASQAVRLDVDLALEPSGFAEGSSVLTFHGDFGSDLAQSMGSRPPAEIEDQMRHLVRRLLPGADVPAVSWQGTTDGLPRFEVTAEVSFESLVQGRSRSLKLDGFQWTPEPSSIEELEGFATALSAAEVYNRFTLRTPEGFCPPAERLDELENNAASFVHRVTSEAGKVVVERTTLAKKSWFTEVDLGDLMALALAEHRAPKRRIRFRCR